jgi:uncharacterized protein YecE (DUF72 family)
LNSEKARRDFIVALCLVKTGCCGFPLSQRKYPEQFPVVEVQHTFYQPPRVSTLQRWRAGAPKDFEFIPKAWQLITHAATSPTYRRVTAALSEHELKECGGFRPTRIVNEAWLLTRACAEALEARWVLFQCPASFSPSPLNIENLRKFFSDVDRKGLGFLWEPRGAWGPQQISDLCRELNLVHAVDPFENATVTHDLFYYRIHGGKDYRYRFQEHELQQLHSVLPRGKPVYVMFNNIAMLENGTRFQQIVAEAQQTKAA